MASTDITFQDVQAGFDQALLLADRDIVRLMTAVILANQLDGPPTWMLIVAAPSGGKSTLLMCLDELELLPGKRMTFFISDLTENTLASGFRAGGSDASLLTKMPIGGMFIFKDFTSLLTKRREGRDAIMGQLREVYDRKFDKQTGNGNNISWKGKVGALAGVTEAVHEYMSQMSIMGDRFIMYSMRQPDRMEAVRFVMKLKVEGNTQEAKLETAKKTLQTYLRHAAQKMGNAQLHMAEEDQEKLMVIADFATKVRSGVVEDERRGHITFVPSAEMPIRLIDQLLSIGTALSHMRKIEDKDPQLGEGEMHLLYKIAFDSIPLKRRWALRQLAKYTLGVTTAGVAVTLGYETEVVKGWLAQLNALGIARRIKSTGEGDQWVLESEYRDLMVTFDHVEVKQGMLTDPDDSLDDHIVNEALNENQGFDDEIFKP